MESLNPIIEGVELAVAKASIKSVDRFDMLLIKADEGSFVCSSFTQNKFSAAPVKISKKHSLTINQNLDKKYLMINSGNANAAVKTGVEDASKIIEAISNNQSVVQQNILIYSTGVIGEPLPVKKMLTQIPFLCQNFVVDNWGNASKAIMTTDTVEKIAFIEFDFEGEVIKLCGIAKGAGMIMPNMATMLSFIATNVSIEHSFLQVLLNDAIEDSFNAISIDGDTSTNDAVSIIATNKTQVKVNNENHKLAQLFRGKLNQLCQDLAIQLVKDAEGATKLIEINIIGAINKLEAKNCAQVLANSPLVKTAFFASDANWGRWIMALGNAKTTLNPDDLCIDIEDIQVVENGVRASNYDENLLSECLKKDKITMNVNLNQGQVSFRYYTCDLSYDYIKINADYRT